MRYALPALSLALAFVLSACGGAWGIEDDEGEEPAPSGRSASVTVSAATETVLHGVYASSDVELGEVDRTDESDPEAEVCSFRFAGLRQSGTSREMEGTITYAPETAGRPSAQLRTTAVSLDGVAYRLEGGTGSGLDLAGDRVLYAGAVLASSSGAARTLTLSGDIPVPTDRPGGC